MDKSNVPQFSEFTSALIKKLNAACYRLAIISNTHRYQDGLWIRNELAKCGILHYFELIIASATYAIHKPNLAIFHKAIDFMQIDPKKIIMVGDSEHCDGACQYLGMSYLKVFPNENWSDKLSQVLSDPMPKCRKLSNIYEYGKLGDKIITKVRHLSEEIKAGDHVIVGNEEMKVVSLSRPVTKEDVLTIKEEFVEITVVNLN